MAGGHRHAFAAADWPFAGLPHDTTVIAAAPLLRERLPVAMVWHDDEGDWHFACGTTDERAAGTAACLGCLFDCDRTLAAVADLPVGWMALRLSPADPWERTPVQTPDNRTWYDFMEPW